MLISVLCIAGVFVSLRFCVPNLSPPAFCEVGVLAGVGLHPHALESSPPSDSGSRSSPPAISQKPGNKWKVTELKYERHGSVSLFMQRGKERPCTVRNDSSPWGKFLVECVRRRRRKRVSEYPFVLIFPGLSLMGGGEKEGETRHLDYVWWEKEKGYPYPPPRLEGKSPKKELRCLRTQPNL